MAASRPAWLSNPPLSRRVGDFWCPVRALSESAFPSSGLVLGDVPPRKSPSGYRCPAIPGFHFFNIFPIFFTFFTLQNLHIPKIFCTFAHDLKNPSFLLPFTRLGDSKHGFDTDSTWNRGGGGEYANKGRSLQKQQPLWQELH